MRFAVVAVPLLVLAACASGSFETREGASGGPSFDRVVSSWPAGPREAAEELAKRYGAPDEVTATRVVWYDNAPWKETVVHRDGIRHDWPEPHRDFIEQTVAFRVDPDRFDEIAKFDGSVFAERTRGTLTARCGKEEMNFLAINLAQQVASGRLSPEAARRRYEETAANFKAGDRTSLTQRLEFQPPAVGTAADPDQPTPMAK